MIKPASCDLAFEVQVGGVWTPLEAVESGNTILFGLPPLLPFRAIFTGTTDVQPGLNKAQSVLKYSRPRTTFKHISKLYTLSSPVQIFTVDVILENYKEANHDLTCTLSAAGTGPALSPATTVDTVLDPPLDARDSTHLRIKRRFHWTASQITAPMSSVKITLDGATTSALDTFHVGERVFLSGA
jgi:hypothetical protein